MNKNIELIHALAEHRTMGVTPGPETLNHELESLGYKVEGTGGGCEARILRLLNGFAIYLTDDGINVPEVGCPACLSVYDDNDEREYEWHGHPEFPSADALLGYLKSEAYGDAVAILAQLSQGDISYALAPERGKFRGFAALHDLHDANEFLPWEGDMSAEENVRRAGAAIEQFNQLVIPQ